MERNMFTAKAALAIMLIISISIIAIRYVTGDIPPPRVTTYAGVGAQGDNDGENARFHLPQGLFFADGRLVAADTENNSLRLVDSDGYTVRFAETLSLQLNRPTDGAQLPDGRILIVDSANHAIHVLDSDGVTTWGGAMGHRDGHVSYAQFNYPAAVAFDDNGYVYIADAGNHVIRMISPSGEVRTVAGVAGQAGFSEGLAGASLLNYPMGVAVTACGGRIYISDTGNHLIRVVEHWYVGVLAGELIMFGDITDDLLENEEDFPVGSLFNLPRGLAMYGDMLVVADSANHRIQILSPGGDVLRVIGTGYAGHIDGALANAEFASPTGLAIVGYQLFVADSGNNVIRRVMLY